MSNVELARWYAGITGVLLVVIGLLGFVENPLVGRPDAADPIFHAGPAQNVLHIASGAVLLFVGFGLTGSGLVYGLLAFGVAYGLVFVVSLVSPDLLGLFRVAANLPDHVLHAGLAVVSAVVAWLVRTAPDRTLAH